MVYFSPWDTVRQQQENFPLLRCCWVDLYYDRYWRRFNSRTNDTGILNPAAFAKRREELLARMDDGHVVCEEWQKDYSLGK